jgi:hypothetical protein
MNLGFIAYSLAFKWAIQLRPSAFSVPAAGEGGLGESRRLNRKYHTFTGVDIVSLCVNLRFNHQVIRSSLRPSARPPAALPCLPPPAATARETPSPRGWPSTFRPVRLMLCNYNSVEAWVCEVGYETPNRNGKCLRTRRKPFHNYPGIPAWIEWRLYERNDVDDSPRPRERAVENRSQSIWLGIIAPLTLLSGSLAIFLIYLIPEWPAFLTSDVFVFANGWDEEFYLARQGILAVRSLQRSSWSFCSPPKDQLESTAPRRS